MSLAGTLPSQAASWKEKSQSLAASVRSTRWLAASFLIALYFASSLPAKLFGWTWKAVQWEYSSAEITWQEMFTWEGLTRTLLALLNDVRIWLYWTDLGRIVTIATCVLAVAWLHSISWKSAFVKLGVSKPKATEFIAPLVATVPALIFVLLSYDTASSPGHWGRHVFSFGTVVEKFFELLPFGLVYKGLIEVAHWSKRKALVVLLVLTWVLPVADIALAGSLAEFEPILLLHGLPATLLTVWIFERWDRRIWSLFFIGYSSTVVVSGIPLDQLESFGISPLVLLWSTPLVLLALWTLWRGHPLRANTSQPAQD